MPKVATLRASAPFTKSTPRLPKPKTFTSREALIDFVREQIMIDGRSYEKIAIATKSISGTTVGSLANGKTRWPRDTTLFPIMRVLGIVLEARVDHDAYRTRKRR